MATYTSNYNLYKPDSSDAFGDFRSEFNNNMDVIDVNLGVGGSKHTIVDENGQVMPNRTYLEFTGGVQVTDDAGNNKTVVDVQGGGGSSSLAGLTDVDLTTPTDGQVLSYDGINSKWVNGAVVFLSEYASAVYSNNEREVGCWTDGKPLYQKTVHINALPDSSQIGQYVEYPHGISDIDTIYYFNGIVHFSNGNAVKTARLGFNANSFDPQISFDAYCSLSYIRICVGSDRSNTSADFTIWYTKTTDAPGSGKMVPSAMPAVHYSTSEQIIGTWIDGKPLYEKVVVIPNTSAINNAFTYPHGILNIEFARITNATTFDASGNAFDLPLINNDGTNLGARLTTTNITFRGTGMLAVSISRNLYVTIQYTKTTD